MAGISLPLKASASSARGKNHTSMLRTIHLLSLIFLISTTSFRISFGTTTDLSPDNGEEASSSTNVNLSSRRGHAHEFEFSSARRPFLDFSKEVFDSGYEAVIPEEATASSQGVTVIDSGGSEPSSSEVSAGQSRLAQTIVSQEGLPNHFRTVQAAVDAVPMWNSVNWIIYIKPGIYNATVVVPQGKNYITLLGEGPAVTTLSCHRSARDTPMGILDCPCVIVEASHFRAENISFENTSPKPAELDYNAQAPAIRVSGDNASFYGCSFLGWQDTLYADQGRHYYEKCRVEGSVDFILGYARALFNKCTIYSRSQGFITAQSRWCDSGCVGASSAFVFVNCTLTGMGPTYLGRPWREYAKVVYVDSWMGSHIVPQGWDDWLDGVWPLERPLFSHDHVYFAEGNSRGPGANPQVRVPWSHQIGEAEVEAHSYRDAKAFLDGER